MMVRVRAGAGAPAGQQRLPGRCKGRGNARGRQLHGSCRAAGRARQGRRSRAVLELREDVAQRHQHA